MQTTLMLLSHKKKKVMWFFLDTMNGISVCLHEISDAKKFTELESRHVAQSKQDTVWKAADLQLE
jgi:hypothetical protein